MVLFSFSNKFLSLDFLSKISDKTIMVVLSKFLLNKSSNFLIILSVASLIIATFLLLNNDPE